MTVDMQVGDFKAEDGLLTITFIMLCHDSAERVIARANKLLEEDPTCKLIVHFDRNSPRGEYQKILKALEGHPRCYVMNGERVRCGWGTWGLVEAPLRAIRYALEADFASDYFYLISEYCYPVQPLIALRQHLTKHAGMEFIESQDSSWIKGGIREDRYLYRHYLDKRKNPKLHRWMYRIQKKLGMKRKLPTDMEVRFGSQWWCLSIETVHRITTNERIKALFRRSWIPDECFFQTSVYSFVDKFELLRKGLTHYEFDEKGIPQEMSLSMWKTSQYSAQKFFLRKVMEC